MAHGIMEAEKSHNLLSANWRPRKASGVIQSESDGLRTRGADDVNPSTGDEISQLKQENRVQIPPFSDFCSIQALRGLLTLTYFGEGNLLRRVY